MQELAKQTKDYWSLVAVLAHELGHAIADDNLREAGYTYRDKKRHMEETQAYFVQHILYDYLARHEDPGISDAARQHFTATMMENIHDLGNPSRLHVRPMGLLASLAIFKNLQEQDQQTRNRVSAMLLDREGPKTINEVLATAGIEYESDMKKLAGKTIKNATIFFNTTLTPALSLKGEGDFEHSYS